MCILRETLWWMPNLIIFKRTQSLSQTHEKRNNNLELVRNEVINDVHLITINDECVYLKKPHCDPNRLSSFFDFRCVIVKELGKSIKCTTTFTARSWNHLIIDAKSHENIDSVVRHERSRKWKATTTTTTTKNAHNFFNRFQFSWVCSHQQGEREKILWRGQFNSLCWINQWNHHSESTKTLTVNINMILRFSISCSIASSSIYQ